jgi:HEAT repeat protein
MLQARDEIRAAQKSPNARLRGQAIEALTLGVGPSAAADVMPALKDPDAPVRFAALVALGQLRARQARPSVLGMLDDPSAHVQAAARFALHKFGDTSRSQELAALSRSAVPGVRANVAMLLGLLEEPSAVKVLRPMQADENAQVRLQVAEALWRLDNQDGLASLVQFSISQYVDDQIFALLAMAAPRRQSVRSLLEGKLNTEVVEVNLAAARGLGMLGSDRGYQVARDALSSREARQRLMAAMALGAIGRSDAQPALAKLLSDDSPQVRLGAAAALLMIARANGAN